MHTRELRAQLDRLHLEMLEAETAGLTRCRAYMEDLEQEMSACRAALVGVSVTEIAVARSQLHGALLG
jgi:hypothetical protein